MPRLTMESPTRAEIAYKQSAEQAIKRLASIPQNQCPVEFITSLVKMYSSDSCGKCTPCRVGIAACCEKLDAILDGNGTKADLETIRAAANLARESADCAIGFTAGSAILAALDGFQEDFESHVEQDMCTQRLKATPPCAAKCPAHINIPAYIACIRGGRYDDALRVIRNDNPLPTVCGYVCEHPCEADCRRAIIDDAVNICGLKRFASDNAQWSAPPQKKPATGKKVAIVGGGPAGLSAAYYLSLMGHDVTIYDQREKLGGMTRYGIPDYRLPQDRLDADVNFILSTGVHVASSSAVGTDVSLDEVMGSHDAVYISIGAHDAKKLGCDGEDAKGVLSAVEFLRATAEGNAPDFSGKRVCIVGGGNVAMDCTRTAKRLGATSVECVYRRRIADMTALPEEIDEAKSEGCQITQLEAPVRIQTTDDGCVEALVTQPQVIGRAGRGGRPAPYAADAPEHEIPCDVVIIAIGQAIDSKAFSEVVETERGCIVVREDGSIAKGTSSDESSRIYAGGDAVSGPATVIKAIAAGKLAAANIDEALGFAHDVYDHVDIPPAKQAIGPCGRVELKDVVAQEAACSFDLAKLGMSVQEATQESSRCLRCDHYGFAATADEEEALW